MLLPCCRLPGSPTPLCPNEAAHYAVLVPLLLQLQAIMSRLLDVGSAVATPVSSSPERKLARVQFPQEATAQLEVCRGGLQQQWQQQRQHP